VLVLALLVLVLYCSGPAIGLGVNERHSQPAIVPVPASATATTTATSAVHVSGRPLHGCRRRQMLCLGVRLLHDGAYRVVLATATVALTAPATRTE
jgi:hypothetical protein